MATLLKIANWNQHFENNRTRELKKMEWVPVPTKQDGDGYTELVMHEQGAAHLGAWLALVEIAAKCTPRGTLQREAGRPHTAESLARISRLPATIFAEAIPRLVAIGWLTAEPLESEEVPDSLAARSQVAAVQSQPSAAEAQEVAVSRTRERAPATRKGMEGKGKERQESSSSESPSATAEPPVLTFPTVGEARQWNLVAAHVEQLREAFPDIDIVAECRKARQWCLDNPPKRKTPKGMAKFLFTWMSTCQNRGGGGARAGPTTDPRHVNASLAAFLARGK